MTNGRRNIYQIPFKALIKVFFRFFHIEWKEDGIIRIQDILPFCYDEGLIFILIKLYAMFNLVVLMQTSILSNSFLGESISIEPINTDLKGIRF